MAYAYLHWRWFTDTLKVKINTAMKGMLFNLIGKLHASTILKLGTGHSTGRV